MIYQRKTKPALWTAVKGARPIRAMKIPRSSRKPKRPLPQMSPRRRSDSRLYRTIAREFLELNPVCERCGAASQCVHHWAGRRSNYLRKETWRASCIACNDFAKTNPAQARAEKWIAPVGVYLT